MSLNHLRTKFDMSPDEYRTKWGLPSDYPMVAPNYAAARNNLAHAIGLGQKRRTNAGRKKGLKLLNEHAHAAWINLTMRRLSFQH